MRKRALRLLSILIVSTWVAACGDDGGGTPDAAVCVPVDDGNPCTSDVCQANQPVHNPVTVGTACPTGTCNAAGMCVATPPTCTDTIENGTETDVDCGGSCAPASTCDTGEGCAIGADCDSGVCNVDVCAAPVCGDGVMQAGEMCDDGNDTNGDGCDDGVGGTCRATGCGNGTVAGTEICDDGNATNGDGCDNNCTATACGNGVTTGTEACDDADLASGDGCSATCTVETGYTCTAAVPSVCTATCGDGIVAGAEACDDVAPAESGDGCSLTCTIENGYTCTGSPSVCVSPAVCGDGIIAGPETCDQGNVIPGDGCSATCTVESGFTCTGTPSVCVAAVVCGDGVIAVPETCDQGAGNVTPGDGCSATCTVESGFTCAGTPSVCVAAPVCGNGVTTAPETCDDGNTVALDGCSATCRTEINELEPNEDGTPSVSATATGTAGNDFDTGAASVAVMNANANGVINVAGGNTILGAISPAGDEDVFAITNGSTVPQNVRLDIWSRAAGHGVGVPCPGAELFDTVLNIRSATGALLLVNDDRNDAADRCSGLGFVLNPGQTVYAHVLEYDDNLALTPGYGLQILATPLVCGDGMVFPATEECDDGNTVDTDACSNTCVVLGLPLETEPNGTVAEADASTIRITGDVTYRGAIGTATDVDAVPIDVAAFTVIRFEAFGGALGHCDASTLTLRLLDSAGAQIVTDNPGDTNLSGVRACAALVFPVGPGTYYIHVEETGLNAAVAKYFLQTDFNTASGAESEAANTMGGNDTIATAATNLLTANHAWVFGDHTLVGDVDVYAITVPPGQGLRAEIIEGDRAAETCESTEIDSLLTLTDAAGLELASDDDGGRGFCSAIDGTSVTPFDPPARNLTMMPQVWYLHVRQSDLAELTQRQFIYRLQITIR